MQMVARVLGSLLAAYLRHYSKTNGCREVKILGTRSNPVLWGGKKKETKLLVENK